MVDKNRCKKVQCQDKKDQSQPCRTYHQLKVIELDHKSYNKSRQHRYKINNHKVQMLEPCIFIRNMHSERTLREFLLYRQPYYTLSLESTINPFETE